MNPISTSPGQFDQNLNFSIIPYPLDQQGSGVRVMPWPNLNANYWLILGSITFVFLNLGTVLIAPS